MADALRQHLGVCNALLELAHKEAQALASSDPFPVLAIQVERKALLGRLEYALKQVSQKGTVWNGAEAQGSPASLKLTRLLRTALDTIMRVLVLDRENEQQLLRRGLLSARCLPAAEQSRPHFVARLYQRHIQS
jgi:flagellar biosynthesis/type III secretory pathway chaperone